MAKKQKGNVPYRNIHASIWTDSAVQNLNDLQFRFFLFSFSSPRAAVSNFGIYEVTRGEIAMYLRCEMDKLAEIIDFFNEHRKEMIEYDSACHILYSKNFTKYQSDYLSTWTGYVPKLLFDWEATKKKVPHFWKEFFFRNKRTILKMNEDCKKDKKNDIGLSFDEFILENSHLSERDLIEGRREEQTRLFE